MGPPVGWGAEPCLLFPVKKSEMGPMFAERKVGQASGLPSVWGARGWSPDQGFDAQVISHQPSDLRTPGHWYS